MAKQSLSLRQRKWLTGQIEIWKSQGVLSEDQAVRILDQYPSPSELQERHHSRAIFTLMGIAALLIGLGAFLVVGYNWEKMPHALKLSIILGVIIGTHALGFFLRFAKHALLLSEVVFFLGCFFYGIGIFLIAQIFNYNAHYPDGIWWWAVGVLPFAICFDTVLLHAALVSLLAIWCGAEILEYSRLGTWYFGRWRHIPNGAYSTVLLALPGFIWTYRRQSIGALYLYVPLMAWWVILQLFAWENFGGEGYFVGGIGSLLLVVAEMHSSGSRYAIPFRLYGTLITAGALMNLSFYKVTASLQPRTGDVQTLIPAVALALLAVGVHVVAKLIQHRTSVLTSPAAEQNREFPHRQLVPVGLIAFMIGGLLWNYVGGGPLLPTILANIAMLSIAFWLMHVGLREDRVRPFAFGVSYFLLWAISRYIDLFGDFAGMLGAALMFFICGAGLFGFALFWRDRKRRQYG